MRQVLKGFAALTLTTVLVFLAACSAAPTPTAQKKETPKPEPPKTADAAVKAVVDGFLENKPVVLWDSLPPSYQKDINELVQSAAGKADPALWNAGWELFAKLINVAKTKRDMILGSEMMAEAKKTVKMDDLKKNWDVVVDVLDTVAKCDLGKIDQAKKADIGKVLSTTGSELMTKLQKLSQLFPPEKMQDNPWVMLKTVKVTQVKADDATATLKIEGGGKPAEDVEFVKVEGKWIPMALAAFWKQEIAKAKKEIADAPKPEPKDIEQMLGMVNALSSAMDTMAKATTQEQFNMGLSQVLGPFMMMADGPGGPGGPGTDAPEAPDANK